MDDLAGILVLLGLVVLAVPLLLIVALVKISNVKLRLEALEREHAELELRVDAAEVARAAPQAAAAQAGMRAEIDPAADATRAARYAAPPAATSTIPQDGIDPDASIGPRGQADIPGVDATLQRPLDRAPDPTSGATPPVADMAAATAMPPPLPRAGAADAGATAAAYAGATAAPPAPPAPPVPPRAPAPPPAPSPFDAWVARTVDGVRRWFTEGNVPVKIGMLVLLAGVASLLKYASNQGWVHVPMELRLAGVAAAAMAGFVFAWKQRDARRAFSLSLQGGAIGVLMLVTFAAFKLYGFIPAGAAFAITIALVAALGVLAVLQDALALAVFGILAGFLAPIWLSTGSGNHVALFGYYAVLNLGIVGMAWAQSRGQGPWRMLNLLGFVFTFGIGTVWGVLDYAPEKFATTEPFLLLFFALYLALPVFYARRRDDGGNAHTRVDGTLVFGTPLVVFALQACLLQGDAFGGGRMPLALSALAAAAIYALLAAALRSRRRFASLVDAYAVLAVGFATLAVPLALSAHATASVFALEGAALVWLGVRQGRALPQITGLLLQLGAAVAFIVGVGGPASGFAAVDLVSRTPLANPAFMGALLIALSGLATAWTYRRTLDAGLVALFTLWAFGWWIFAGAAEILEFVPGQRQADALFAFAAGTAWIAAELRRRFADLPALGGIAAAALLLGVPFAIVQTVDHRHPFGEWGAVPWAVFALLGWRALICLRDAGTAVRLVAHGGWLWAWVVALALALRETADVARLGDGWELAAFALPLLALAGLLQLRPALLAPPLARPGTAPGSRGFDDYRALLHVSAAGALALVWLVSLLFPGDATPLPWVTVVNPLELFQLAALALLARRAWAGRGTTASRPWMAAFALSAFAWISLATLRGAHHWGGAAWSPDMLDDYVVQTALTVVWSVLGVLAWIFGSRRGDRLMWGAGAVLMGVVLLKLLVIDRSYLGDLFGIVSFITYGLLCTAVGYFAPAPPRRAATAETAA